ncbi:MAG: porin [Rhodospirillales bacterium]|nr:porin [Rhodospirillales bacterium]
MRKSLYMTTALAAAGMLAFGATGAVAGSHTGGKIKIGLGGFLNTYIGYAEQDGSFESTASATTRVGYDQINIKTDSEVYFTGGTKLDNGVGVNVVIQLEGDPSGANGAIDESYVKLTGGFGDVRIGSTKFASFVLRHEAPGAGAVALGNPDTDSFIVRPAASSVAGAQGTHIGAGDQMKLVYITPKMNGFRVGASYVPSTVSNDAMPAVGGTAGTDVQMYDLVASYENKLGGMDLKADVAAFREQGPAAVSVDGRRFGITMGFGAVTIGGSVLNEDAVDSGQSTLVGNPDMDSMDVGMSYKMSAATTVGLTFFNAKKENASGTAGEDSVTKYGAGINHSLGSGVTFVGSLANVQWEDESTADADNNDGWLAVAGIKVGF